LNDEEASTQNVETQRHAVRKRILSYAKMNQKCVHCGSVCKKMMLFESKIVYTLSSAEEETERKRGRDKTSLLFTQKYLTPLEAR
jgi:hypothetical protein